MSEPPSSRHSTRAPQLALERLTWLEVVARQRRGWRTLLVPLGATEQHGPHRPVGFNNYSNSSTSVLGWLKRAMTSDG